MHLNIILVQLPTNMYHLVPEAFYRYLYIPDDVRLTYL